MYDDDTVRNIIGVTLKQINDDRHGLIGFVTVMNLLYNDYTVIMEQLAWQVLL